MSFDETILRRETTPRRRRAASTGEKRAQWRLRMIVTLWECRWDTWDIADLMRADGISESFVADIVREHVRRKRQRQMRSLGEDKQGAT